MKWLKGLMFALVCVWITSSSLTVQAETNVFEQFPFEVWSEDYNPMEDVLFANHP